MSGESTIPIGSGWKWKDHRGVESGVDVYQDTIEWWEAPPQPAIRFAGGAAMNQSHDAFIAEGPPVECPMRVVREMVAAFGLDHAEWWKIASASGAKKFSPLSVSVGGHRP